MIARITKGRPVALAAVLALGVALTTGACGGSGAAGDLERIDKVSDQSFDETLSALTAAIRDANLVLINEVNYQQMLRMVDMETEGMRSYEIFHPRYGARLFGADRSGGLEVPFRVFVRQDGDGAVVSYYQPSSILGRYSGMGDLGRELDEVFATMTDRATQATP